MAKKKVAAQRTVKVAKKAAKKTVKPKAKASAGPVRKTVKKAVKKKARQVVPPAEMRKKVAAPAKTDVQSAEASRPDVGLGRPLVTQEEKLYMLFHDDYQCRQVFEFLRVETVKELEQFSPHQIVHMMSRPIRLTIDRIRQRLAQYKRALKDDEQFAADFRTETKAASG